MLTFVRYEDEILLQYNREADCFEFTEDDNLGFPYEFYDFIEVNGKQFCQLYLEKKEDYITVREDRWVLLSEAVTVLNNTVSRTPAGRQKNKELSALIGEYSKVSRAA